jgi:AsmA protein
MKRTIRILGIALALLLLVVIALPFLVDANQFRPTLESKLSQALGREVKVGHLKLALFSGGVSADDLSIADDPAYSRAAFVQAKSLRLGVDLPALIFSRKLAVTGLTIDQPQIALIQSASGRWNFSNLGGKPATAAPAAAPGDQSKLDLSVKLVKIDGGRFTLTRAGRRAKPLVLENVEARVRDFSPSSPFPFSLAMDVAGGGAIKLDGRAGPIDQTDVSRTPATLTLSVTGLDLAGSGLNSIAPGLAGVVSLDGSGESNGQTINLHGKLKADKLRLAEKATPAKPTVELDFAVAHDLVKRSGVVRRGDIHIGRALAKLTGAYTPEGDSTALNMNLAGANMPASELAAMLPAIGVALPMGSSLDGGTAAVKMSMQGRVDRLVTTGTVGLHNARLTGFDLPQKIAVVATLAGVKATKDTEIQELTSNLRMAPEGIAVDGLKFIAPAIGDLEGGGTISPANALDFKMQAAVRASGLLAIANNRSIPFLISGTCSQPVFRPDVKGMATQQIRGLTGDAGKLLSGLLGGKKQN